MERVPTLRRRRFLIASGAMVAIAGCTGSGDDEEEEEEEEDEEEEEEEEEEEQEQEEVEMDAPHPTDDDHGYDVETYEDIEVPIVPIEDALEWHGEEVAHFVDARGSEDSHENARIPGSVWSTYYPDGRDDDPVDEWDSDEPIVVYSNEQEESSLCVMRAGQLTENGYEYVYAMGDGFVEWRSQNYPMEGLGPDGELEGDDEDDGDED